MKQSYFLLAAVAILSMLLFGCASPQPAGGGNGDTGCGSFGPPQKITGVSPCGSAGSPAVVAAGAAAEYAWNAGVCYDHFKFQLRKGEDWDTANNLEDVGNLRGNVYATTFPAEAGSYMWNVQGFDKPDDTQPTTANYPPCYFKAN